MKNLWCCIFASMTFMFILNFCFLYIETMHGDFLRIWCLGVGFCFMRVFNHERASVHAVCNIGSSLTSIEAHDFTYFSFKLTFVDKAIFSSSRNLSIWALLNHGSFSLLKIIFHLFNILMDSIWCQDCTNRNK